MWDNFRHTATAELISNQKSPNQTWYQEPSTQECYLSEINDLMSQVQDLLLTLKNDEKNLSHKLSLFKKTPSSPAGFHFKNALELARNNLEEILLLEGDLAFAKSALKNNPPKLIDPLPFIEKLDELIKRMSVQNSQLNATEFSLRKNPSVSADNGLMKLRSFLGEET